MKQIQGEKNTLTPILLIDNLIITYKLSLCENIHVYKNCVLFTFNLFKTEKKYCNQ